MKRQPIAILDACVLVPMPLADTLLRLAEPEGLFGARWTDRILAEVTRTLETKFAKSPEKARYREQAIREYFPAALVHHYEPRITEMTNHPKDRHVLAAAIECKADYLVTFNLKDFVTPPSSSRLPTIVGPSTFLKQLWSLDRLEFDRRLRQQADAIGMSVEHLLDRLANAVPTFVESIRSS